MVDSGSVLDVPVVMLNAWRPELALTVTLLVGFGLGRRLRQRIRLVLLAGLALAAGFAGRDLGTVPAYPLGEHFRVDGPAGVVRVAVLSAALLVALALPRGAWRAAPLLALSALGLVWLGEAVTVGALLVAIAASILGGSLAAWFAATVERRRAVRRWHLTATLGFAVLTGGAALWSGLAGTLRLDAATAGLAGRTGLPPLALPLILACLGVGLVLALLLEPGRFQEGEREVLPAALTGWLTAVPPIALVILLHRLLPAATAGAPFAVVPDLIGAIAVVLVFGGFLAALAQRSLPRQLAWAAAGQVGLALLGYATAVPGGGVAVAGQHVLVFAPAQLGAILLAGILGENGRAHGLRDAMAVLLVGLLLSLAAVPPLAGWRPRLGLLQALVAGDRYLLAGAAAVGTVLGCVVYLRPLVGLWRRRLDGHIAAPAGNPAALPAPGTALDSRAGAAPAAAGAVLPSLLVAAALLALVLAWGVGLLRPGSALQ